MRNSGIPWDRNNLERGILLGEEVEDVDIDLGTRSMETVLLASGSLDWTLGDILSDGNEVLLVYMSYVPIVCVMSL